MPSASATTWAVAAVPRNWQPPPGKPPRGSPFAAAYSRSIRSWVKRAPMVWIAHVLGPGCRQRDAAGHDDAGQIAAAGQGQHHGR